MKEKKVVNPIKEVGAYIKGAVGSVFEGMYTVVFGLVALLFLPALVVLFFADVFIFRSDKYKTRRGTLDITLTTSDMVSIIASTAVLVYLLGAVNGFLIVLLVASLVAFISYGVMLYKKSK